MSTYDDLSPRAHWYLENFDYLALAEIAASHDTSRAAVLREAAALLRAAPSNGIGNDWNWWDAATIPDSCAALLEAEANRLTTPADTDNQETP